MKLDNHLKQKIDDYFAKISAEELHNILTKKYNFVENNFSEDDNILLSKLQYKNTSALMSNAYWECISYINKYDIDQNIESILVKPIKCSSSKINDSEINYGDDNIPLAA